MAPRKRPKKQLVYEGPVGRCACCDRTTEIRIGSTIGEPDIAGWTASVDLLRALYQEVGARIKERTTKGKTQLYVTDPGGYDSTKRTKFFFVEGANKEIAGPFGPMGLKIFLHGTMSGPGRLQDLRVYIVGTTHRALTVIQNSPFAHTLETDSGEEALGEDQLF